jgi:CubicO group peptidase (beta-lactamase class C family)
LTVKGLLKANGLGAGMEALHAFVEQQLERWSVPGASVGLLLDGARETRGYGVTSLGTREPVAADTPFRIASISKPFTATLAMNLAEKGIVELDAPIGAYLPGLRLADEGAQRRITLRHLLTHRSGLFREFDEDHGSSDDALERAVARFSALPQVVAPGEMWSYSNPGYHLAGAALARALGTTFEAAMQGRVFGPLGLGSTRYDPDATTGASSAAVGHVRGADGGYEPRPRRYPRNRNPAGGIVSTVGDLLSFASFHKGRDADGEERVLAAGSIRAMQEPQARADSERSWGIGWELREVGGARVVGHSGGVDGYASRLSLVPERGFALAVLTNAERGDAAIRRIERRALEVCCGLEVEEPAVIELAQEHLGRLAGRYRYPGAEVLFVAEDGGLRVEEAAEDPETGETHALPPTFLRPVSDRDFVVVGGENDGWRVAFRLDEDGEPRFAEMVYALAERVD